MAYGEVKEDKNHKTQYSKVDELVVAALSNVILDMEHTRILALLSV